MDLYTHLDNMARRLQTRWRRCVSDPSFTVCRRRIIAETQQDTSPKRFSAPYDWSPHRKQIWCKDAVTFLAPDHSACTNVRAGPDVLELFRDRKMVRQSDDLTTPDHSTTRPMYSSCEIARLPLVPINRLF